MLGTFRSVRLMAGYGDNLSEVLNGNIKEALSCKEEGAVDIVTQIDAFDWSFAMINSESNWTSIAPAPKQEVISRLVNDIVGVGSSVGNLGIGSISTFEGSYPRPYMASGNTWELLKHETNDHCFIDNGLIHCLLDDDCYKGDITVVSAFTGLLSSPKKSGFIVKVDTLFEPSIKVGQKIELRSETETLYNGMYKVLGVQHSGVISGAVNGKCRTSLILNMGEKGLNLVEGETTSPVALSQ